MARGAKQKPHAVKNGERAAYPPGNRKPHAVKQRKATAHGPRGKGKPRSERRSRLRQLTTPCCLATATKASTALFRSSRV
jgi:hypothetical protein